MNPGQIYERSQNYQQAKLTKLRRLKQEVACSEQILEKEQQENVGKPQVNRRFALDDRLPLVDRMQSILSSKSRRLEDVQRARKLKEEAELKECTFRPVTNNKDPPKGDLDHLFDWARAKQSKIAEIALRKEADLYQSRSARKADPLRDKSSCLKKSAEASAQKSPRRQPGAGPGPAGSHPPSPSPAKKPCTASKSPSFAKQRQAPEESRSHSKVPGGRCAITVEQLFEANQQGQTAAAKQIEKHLRSLAANVKHQQTQQK